MLYMVCVRGALYMKVWGLSNCMAWCAECFPVTVCLQQFLESDLSQIEGLAEGWDGEGEGWESFEQPETSGGYRMTN